MVDVFDEVEEGLRGERWKTLAKTWLPWAAGALVLLLVIVLGVWAYGNWQDGRTARASVAYDRGLQALQAEDVSAAQAAFEEAADAGSSAYRAMSLMQQAGLALQQDDTARAMELFDEAARAHRDPHIADLARLKAAYLAMDTETLDQARTRLTAINAEGRPFAAYANEALALLLVQHGQLEQARPILTQLTLGQNVSDGVRQRAQALSLMIDNGTASAIAGIVERMREASAQSVDTATAATAPAGAPSAPPAE